MHAHNHVIFLLLSGLAQHVNAHVACWHIPHCLATYQAFREDADFWLVDVMATVAHNLKSLAEAADDEATAKVCSLDVPTNP